MTNVQYSEYNSFEIY